MKLAPLKQFKSTKLGFTLIEILVVITIIAVLAGLSVAGFAFFKQQQAESQAKLQLIYLEDGLQLYYEDYGTYPEGNVTQLYLELFGEVDASGNLPRDITPYVADLQIGSMKPEWVINVRGKGFIIVDPWKNPYQYNFNSEEMEDYELYSLGKDGKDSSDDIGREDDY